MRYIFGPVSSHRLGLSLGLDAVPRKTCNFNCLYCELGRTGRRSRRRAAHVPAAALLGELEAHLATHPAPEVLTVCGSGEPTLNSELEAIIAGAKATGLPVALLTNGSLFVEAGVRREALGADIIMPSLDAADDATLRRVNRPLGRLSVADYVEGLAALSRRFSGRLLLEVMLVAQVNDSPGHLERLARLCRQIAPERVQLTTVLRPPAEEWARPVSGAALAQAQELFAGVCGCPVDVPPKVAACAGPKAEEVPGLREELLALLERRPITAAQAALALGAAGAAVRGVLAGLRREGAVERRLHQGRPYWRRLS